ncbi:hypothetical protein GCM10023322_69420 [Rugosimonospora acidiphila]|uniref:PknH-like extracellular domain-containing protein n=1 Tax=Rugosimonospora acidiphila TaxID=556531 RepID=A0ABP9SM51_9ACTN
MASTVKGLARTCAAGLVLVVMLAGCGNPRPASRGAPSPPAGSVSHSPPSLDVDVVDFATRSGSWPSSEDDLENASNQLDRQCLRAHGFAVPAAPPLALPVPQDEAAAIDLPGRRSVGYGLAKHSAPAPEPTTFVGDVGFSAAQFGAGKPRIKVSLEGKATVLTPSAGCVAQGYRELAGDLATWARLYYVPQQFDDRMYAAMYDDPRYPVALATWRSCMNSRGYSYSRPDDVEPALRARYDASGMTPALEQLELRTAVDDGECQLAVHLPTTLLQIRRSLVASLPRSDLATIATMVVARRGAVAKARSVLAAGQR